MVASDVPTVGIKEKPEVSTGLASAISLHSTANGEIDREQHGVRRCP